MVTTVSPFEKHSRDPVNLNSVCLEKFVEFHQHVCRLLNNGGLVFGGTRHDFQKKNVDWCGT